MAIPTEMGVSFTQAEVDSMKASLQSVIDLIRAKKAVNLTNDERQSLSSISDERAPYVLKSISEYGVSYPKLNSMAYDLSKATADLDTFGSLFEVLTTLSEAVEVTEEMQMAAGHFAYKFMRDQYMNAERYRGDNVEGAQVVYDGLKGAFEGQGPQAGPAV